MAASSRSPNVRSLASEETNLNELPKADLILHVTGAFGKYQLLLCLLVFLSKFSVAAHQIGIVFLAPKVEYKCPSTDAETCPCPNPVYNREIFTNTMTMKWDLICDKKWLANFSQTLLQLGTLVGSLLFGMASDRFGRRQPLLVAVVVQVVTGIAAAFAPDFWSFTIIRFIVGMSVAGNMVIGFVIVMEFVGTQYRDLISALYQVPFNLGHMLLPLIGYFLRDFTHFQLAISVPTLILLSYFVLLPETPRWLIAMKRTDEAIHILERVAKVNNRPSDNIRADVEAFQRDAEQHHLKKGNITDLFRTPNMRKNIIAMSYNWLTCSYCFYGVSQYMGQLSGDVFINVAFGATLCLIGTLLSIPLMKVMGRRSILILFNFLCGFCLCIVAVIPEGIASVVCVSVGAVSSFIVFVIVYLYCSELFPTVVRNAAVGFSSMMARIGSMLAPFVIGLRDYGVWMPPLVFAIVPLVAAVVTLLLPETKGCKLMTTLEEGEEFGKRVQPSEVNK